MFPATNFVELELRKISTLLTSQNPGVQQTNVLDIPKTGAYHSVVRIHLPWRQPMLGYQTRQDKGLSLEAP